MPAEVIVNHVGHAVADLHRARRFWTEVFDFVEVLQLEPPDQGTSELLGLAPPVGLQAIYLKRGGFILELLHYSAAGHEERRRRPMNEPGLTHLSLLVDSLDPYLDRVRAAGGEVLDSTRLKDHAIMIRDPDGQLVELLTRWRRPG